MKKRHNAKIYFLLIILITAVMFSNFGSEVNISQRVIVHAMGIDSSEKGYKVTLQVFHMSGAGGDTPVDVSQPNVQIITCEGKTVSEALVDASNQLGKEVFLGHLRIICFGRGMDFSRPEELSQFALKDKNIYLGVQLCMSDSTAAEIMNTQIAWETTSAEASAKILQTNVKNSTTLECQLLDFLSCINMPHNIPMPLIAAAKTQENEGGESGGEKDGGSEQDGQQDEQIVVKGTALIKDGRLLEDHLTPEESQGAAWLCDKAERGYLVIKHRDENINVKLTKDKTKIRLVNENGRLVYRVEITVVAHTTVDIRGAEESVQVAGEVSEKMKNIMSAAENKALRENKTDIFKIWTLLRHSFPKSYLEYHDRLDEIYAVTDFDIKLKVRVE